MTYAENIQQTAEMMATIKYPSFPKWMDDNKKPVIDDMLPLAIKAVEMKAHGLQKGIDMAKNMFHQGVLDGNCENLDFYMDNLGKYKQDLGLIKTN